MKKFSALMMVALVGSAMAFTSCNKKKDWVCKCTVAGTITETPYNDQKKSDAEDACDQLEAAASVIGGSCSLSEK